MTSQAVNHRSSILRYRPGIIAFLVVAVGCTGYYIHTTISASSVFKPVENNGRLQRSNAVRRSRRPRPTNPMVMERVDQSLLSSRVWSSAFHYGYYTAFDSHGRAIKLNLINSDLISASRLVSTHGISYRDAVRIREEVEISFLDAFFARTMPVGPIIHISEDVRQILVEKLGSCNDLSPQNIEDALDRYANGELEDHFNRIERREYADEEGQQYQLLAEQLRGHNEPADRHPDLSNDRSGHSTTEQGLDLIPQPHDADDGQSGVDNQQPSAATGQGNVGETSYNANLPPETIVSLSEHEHVHDQGDHKKQTALSLLYNIAEENARKDGYIHRGVTCNSCNTLHIRGIRYRCANCVDYDNCEICESQQLHDRTHLFYKVRVPAPFLGKPWKPQPVWYPGKSQLHGNSLTKEDKATLCQLTGLEEPRLDALWDQFKCLAAVDYPDDPSKYYLAIDRATFDKCLIPRSTARPPPPNLIYDRIFSFYDTDNNGLIGFQEFVFGIHCITLKKPEERLRQVFKGFDIDDDNFISRVDLQRMFKALFELHKELAKDIVVPMDDDDFYDENAARNIVNGSQALSSAFSGNVGTADPSRIHEGKERNAYGDYVITDDGSIEPVKPENSTLQHGPEVHEVQDYGQDILYDVIHDSINELLDPLFKFREDIGLEVLHTKADREKCQEHLAELRMAGLWIGIEYLINGYHENKTRQGLIPNDKPRDFFDFITNAPQFQVWTPSSRIRQRNKRLADTWGPLKALGWGDGPPQLPETLQDALLINKKLDEFLKNVKPSLSSRQYEEFYKTSIDADELLLKPIDDVPVEDSDTPKSARNGFDPAESSERIARQYECSGAQWPIDPTLPQNRPSGSDSDLETGPTGSPPLEWYKYLSLMELLERLDDNRGGPGRVSWPEFEYVMKGPKAEELKFLGSWIEMALI